MLRIRLTRTGKKSQPSYRIVVAEHTAPIKSKFVEVVGHYNLSVNPRELIVDQDRVKYWISVGAKPTDRVATLLKGEGMENMDQYIGRRDLKRKKKKQEEAEGGEGGGAAVTEEAPADDAAPKEEPKDEEKVEEAKEEEEKPKEDEKPAEEAPKEEPKDEKPAEEEAPKEDDKKPDSDTPASEEEAN